LEAEYHGSVKSALTLLPERVFYARIKAPSSMAFHSHFTYQRLGLILPTLAAIAVLVLRSHLAHSLPQLQNY